MTPQQKEDLEGYILRMIPDIARKCAVTNDEVILILSTFIPCDMKDPCCTTDEDRFKVVTWPEIQDLMDIPGFEDNSYLINDEKGLDTFGSSAYFVKTAWLNSNKF